MKKQLHVENLFEWHKAQQFQSLDEEFTSFKEIVLQAIEEQNGAVLIRMLGNYSEPFIIYGDTYEVVAFFLEVEQPIQEKCPDMLAVLYLVVGHCYFVNLNKPTATRYYKKATSLAFEFGLFEVMSITVNNAVVLNYDVLPDELLYENSKMPVVFFLLKYAETEAVFPLRMHTHIEAAIRTKRYAYASDLFDRYYRHAKFDPNSRFHYQIQILNADLLFAQGHYREAQKNYHEVLMACIGSNQQKDLIIQCYKQLSACYQALNDKKLQVDFEQSAQKFLQDTRVNNALIDHYFNRLKFSLTENKSAEKQQFEQQAAYYLSQDTKEGYTLVVVELKTKSRQLAFNDAVFNLLQQEMTVQFTTDIIAYVRYDAMTMLYLVAIAEPVLDEQVKSVFATIRTHYPKEQSELEAIYFASVNNKKNELTTYEQCLELAYAYVYYELYK